MAKRTLGLFMTIILAFSIVSFSAYAVSQDEAVQWAWDRINEHWAQDVDGASSVQCVDLIKAYYQFLV